MTINFFLQSHDFGGAEQFALDLLTSLSQQKQQVVLYTSNSSLSVKISQNRYLQVKKLPVYLDFAGNWRGLLKSLCLSPYALLAYLRLFAQIKKNPGQQIVVYSGFSEKILPGWLAKFYQLPIYFIEYGPLEPIFQKLAALPSYLYLLSKNSAKKVIVPSKHTFQALTKYFPKTKLVYLPCGVKAAKISQRNKFKAQQLCVVSRLEKGKGQDLLIKAFLLIKKVFPQVSLHIIGQGQFLKDLRSLAKNDPQIKFLAFVKHKEKLLLESELIICPSVWPLEGFGLTIVEAMALAKPIVAFDRPPGNELLTHERNALLAKDGDYRDLAKQIIKLLADQRLQKKLATQAHKDFRRRFEITTIAQQYLDLFRL